MGGGIAPIGGGAAAGGVATGAGTGTGGGITATGAGAEGLLGSGGGTATSFGGSAGGILGPVPAAVAVASSTFFMISMTGRFVPAMAMITSSVEPEHRGGFMSVNSAVPEPSEESSSDGRVVFDYGQLGAGHTQVCWIYFQVNPTNLGKRSENIDVKDGNTQLAHIHRAITVFP